MSDRCFGQCCKAFVLGGYDREVIQKTYDNELRMVTEGMTDWVKPSEYWFPEKRVKDILDWWPWMVYIGRFDEHPVTGETNKADDGLDYFTCVKLSPEGDCLAYENRPHFCRSYGITIPCEHKDCQWSAGWHKGEQRELTKLEKEILEFHEKADLPIIDLPSL
jgi:Fe-S-cluster containining protein